MTGLARHGHKCYSGMSTMEATNHFLIKVPLHKMKLILGLLLGKELVTRLLFLLNGHSIKLTLNYFLLYPEMHLLTLIREASICSRQRLTQRSMTGQSAENKRMLTAQP